MVFVLRLIKTIHLHYRNRKKYLYRKRFTSFFFLPKKTCAHLELKETKNITHFVLLTTYSLLALSV